MIWAADCLNCFSVRTCYSDFQHRLLMLARGKRPTDIQQILPVIVVIRFTPVIVFMGLSPQNVAFLL